MTANRLRGHIHSFRALSLRLALLTCLVAAGVATLRANTSRAALPHHSAHSAPPAATAKTITLSEHANLHLLKSNGVEKLYEQGHGYGTFNCPVQLNLTISARQVSVAATFTAFPSGGSVNGSTIAHYRIVGTTSYFTGTLAITHGTGRFAHASGSLQLSGQMDRTSYAAKLQVTGRLNV
jgi:hypothetical protein